MALLSFAMLIVSLDQYIVVDIEELLPDVLDGAIEPGRVFDRSFSLEQVPDAYRAMADRRVLKALIAC